MELPLCDDLWAILNEFSAWRHDTFKDRGRDDTAMTFFVTSRLTPWTSDGLKTSFSKERDKMLAKGEIGAGLTFHGGRHTVATLLADEGFEDSQTKHLLGHGKQSITEHYSSSSRRVKLLTELSNAVQSAYRNAGWNVIDLGNMGNKSV